MPGQLSSLFEVTVDFETSHLFFPRIILWLLLILGIVIIIQRGPNFLREIRSGERSLRFLTPDADKFRLFGTLLLMTLYFLGMEYVGEFFPNTGYGFWFVSIPFLFALSSLYAHTFDKRKLAYIALNALIAPTLAWYVLSELFNVTLP